MFTCHFSTIMNTLFIIVTFMSSSSDIQREKLPNLWHSVLVDGMMIISKVIFLLLLLLGKKLR
jgi:hypothetical protein